MNLLSLLLSAMMSKEAINTIAKKTGISKNLIRQLMPLAIPLLIRYLTKNASSANGASSLFSALGQHTSKRSMAEQIQDGDETDGEKIVRHILGNDSDHISKQLAARSGLSTGQVLRILAIIAPAILSVLSSASNSAHQQSIKPQSSGPDLSSLLSLYGGQSYQQPQQQAPSMSGLGLLGTLLGAGSQPQQSQAPAASQLFQQMMNSAAQSQQNVPPQQSQPLSAFQQPKPNASAQAPQNNASQQQPTPMQLGMNGLQPAGSQGPSSSSGLTSLFGSMLGGGSQQTPTESMLDGSDLLGILSALYH